ncbi:MAG: hypothetical protein K8I27_16870 [Planctomycetes bacterium]|nr:hypothetical protein [Planctomycetota bacterium]
MHISAALKRARSRWLLSAMVNAGGRWAVLPAGVVALIGIVLALAGERSLGWLLLLAGLGVAGVGAALVITRRIYARPAASGAPDWTLLLDRALGLDDALPTWIEAEGQFRRGMEERVAAGLDPVREKRAAPKQHWGGLAIALLLALMPLVFWRPDGLENPPVETLADTPGVDEPPVQGAPGDAEAGASEGAGKGDGAGEGEAEGGTGGGGDEGDAKKRPDGSSDGEGAGEQPNDAQPRPRDKSPKPENNEVGDTSNPHDRPPPKPEDKDIDSNIDKVKPKPGDGETRTEETSRWVYNPNGEKLDGSIPKPRDVNHPGEKAVPRTRITRSERELIEKTYRELYGK